MKAGERRIVLEPDVRRDVARELKAYLVEKHDLELGDLGAGLLIDFLLESLGPPVYNRALLDAQAFLQDRLLDMEALSIVRERRGR